MGKVKVYTRLTQKLCTKLLSLPDIAPPLPILVSKMTIFPCKAPPIIWPNSVNTHTHRKRKNFMHGTTSAGQNSGLTSKKAIWLPPSPNWNQLKPCPVPEIKAQLPPYKNTSTFFCSPPGQGGMATNLFAVIIPRMEPIFLIWATQLLKRGMSNSFMTTLPICGYI